LLAARLSAARRRQRNKHERSGRPDGQAPYAASELSQMLRDRALDCVGKPAAQPYAGDDRPYQISVS
jgi:hypothetical protein